MFDFLRKKSKNNGSDQTPPQKTVTTVAEETPNTKEEAPSSSIETTSSVPSEESSSWLSKLASGLSKSSSKLTSGIGDIFTKRKLDSEALEQLEELLIASDMGLKTSAAIIAELSRTRLNKDISPEEIKHVLAEQITAILAPVARPLTITHKPHVIFVTGVNGNGKTTTIGKLAKQFKEQGRSVMMAACDTFRAAAVEQLKIWAERVGCPIVTGPEGADPASVAYQALEKAKSENVDVLIIDTAGRLHNKANLMAELEKIVRALKKLDETTPHDTLLVLDATTGQNAHNQVQAFKAAVNLSGLIVTKLDGTAKGGVVVGLAKEYAMPIHAIGVGEGINDLQAFTAEHFAKGLVGSE